MWGERLKTKNYLLGCRITLNFFDPPKSFISFYFYFLGIQATRTTVWQEYKGVVFCGTRYLMWSDNEGTNIASTYDNRTLF